MAPVIRQAQNKQRAVRRTPAPRKQRQAGRRWTGETGKEKKRDQKKQKAGETRGARPNGRVVWLSGCLAVWLSGCLAVWLSGCLAVLHVRCVAKSLARARRLALDAGEQSREKGLARSGRAPFSPGAGFGRQWLCPTSS